MPTKLEQVRDLIAKGWIQHQMFDGLDYEFSTKFCILGACEAVAGGYDSTLVDKLRAQLPRGRHLATFNDYPGRTQADILNLIDKAINADKT